MSEKPPLASAVRSRLGAVLRAARGTEHVPHREPDDQDVQTLVDSGLFDHDWYSLCLRRRLDRQDAAAHYLAEGRLQGLTPHPLVIPDHLVAQDETLVEEDEDTDPFLVYLRERRYELATHPLFDLQLYLAQHPQALAHPWGPVGHYQEVGARQRSQVNAWYTPGEGDSRGLVDWIWREARAWSQRRRTVLPLWGRAAARERADADVQTGVGHDGLLSVVFVAESGDEGVRRSIDSVVSQVDVEWELLVLLVDGGPSAGELDLPDDDRVRVVPGRMPSLWAARNLGLAVARGDYVCWMTQGDRWLPGRLRSLREGLAAGSPWAHDCARNDESDAVRRHASRHATRARLEAGIPVEISTVAVSRRVLIGAGGFDETLPGGQLEDALLTIDSEGQGGFVPRLGVLCDLGERRERREVPPSQRPFIDLRQLSSRREVVLNKHLPWPALQSRKNDDGLVSVVMPTYEDWRLTTQAVERLVEADRAGHRLEVVVVDNGCSAVPAGVLAALPARFEEVRLVRTAMNHGFAYGSNLGLRWSHGSTVVFLNNDTEVDHDWLAPLLTRLEDPAVLGAQPLLVYPEGAVQAAGVVFPRGKGLPYHFLQGFPQEDAAAVAEQEFSSITAAALAMRTSDVVRVRGFDCIYANGMEDIDLCLRLKKAGAGHFAVVPRSIVVHHESRTPGRFKRSLVNRRVFLDRWHAEVPEDDVSKWEAVGFELHGHERGPLVHIDHRLSLPIPVVLKPPRPSVHEGLPALRWAIKNPAPYGPEAEEWGDTHFARQLAAALRGLGQEVVIDHRGEFGRQTGWHDDVALLLRGLAPYTPVAGQVNLMWLISHPEMLARSEPLGWDRIFVASATFAERLRVEWGVSALPLLQATDPSLFHPDRAQPDTGHPVLFLGSSRRVLRPLVAAALEAQLSLSVIGNHWSGLIPDRYVRASYLPNAEAGAAYRAAGVVLNDHWEDMRVQGFLSNRLFDAVASGARVVTDDAVGVEEVFGDAVRIARSAEELSALVDVPDLDAVFGSDEVRRERAARVAEQHSFTARARVLIEEAARVRSSRGLL